MKRFFFCSLLMIIITTSLSAQRKALDFFTAVKGDSVYLFFNQSPRLGQSFLVERQAPKADRFERLTTAAIEAVTDANQAQQMLGPDYNVLATALKVNSAQELLVKLKTDPFYGQVAMLLNRPVARVLGRFFAQAGHQSGAVYRYRVLRVDRKQKILESVEQDILIRENPPQPIKSLTGKQEKMSVIIEWDYPKWSGAVNDLAFQFLLFRSSANGKFQCLHDKPILRLEGMPYRFVDKEISLGQTYIYRMVAVDAAGLISQPVETVVKTQDNIPPQRPTDLTAQVENNKVALKWKRSSDQDLAGYHIYRWFANQKDSVRITSNQLPADKTAFLDSTVNYGVVCYYAVTAVDKAGNESLHSDRAHALVTDKTPPRPPRSLAARVKDHTVILSWPPSPDADVAGYQVRRGYDEKNAFNMHKDLVKDTVFVCQSDAKNPIEPGRRYYFSVVSIDTMKYKSTPVGTWCSIPDDQPPEKPGRVVAENHLGREIKITWNRSLSQDVSGYVIKRIALQDTTLIDTCASNRLVFTDKTVRVAQKYTYSVAAMDTAGNISLSSFSNPITLRDFTPPTSPAFVSAVLSDQRVRIKWEPVGDFDLAGYNVYRSTLPTGIMVKLNTLPQTDLEFVDGQGKAGNWYTIRAVDTSGNESTATEAVQAR